MPQSLVKNHVHLVFSTKHRQPCIKEATRARLFAYMSGILSEWESPALCIGGVEDHVHALISLSKNQPLKKIVEEVKLVALTQGVALGCYVLPLRGRGAASTNL